MKNEIHIKGARVHNLKNIDITLPRNKFIVITGISGSGKSSLAFDTIYAEGQRRYVESLSAYARQFLGQMDKPDVDYIEGLSPAISIEQKSISKNPRSTVGTITEIYDYLRLLYANIGIVHCPNCGKSVSKQSVQEIVEQVLAYPDQSKIIILAPLVRGRKGEYLKLFDDLRKKGFGRVRVDGVIMSLEDNIKLNKKLKHQIEVVVDRTSVIKDNHKRIFESIETALKEGNHLVDIMLIKGKSETIHTFSELFACVDCNISIPEMTPRLFSFNSPYGACKDCNGLGQKYEFDVDKVIPNPSLSIMDGALDPWKRKMFSFRGQILQQLSKHFRFNLHTPFKKLSSKTKDIILHGTDEEINYKWRSRDATSTYEYVSDFEGILAWLDRKYTETDNEDKQAELRQYMTIHKCHTCKGQKLNEYARAVTIGKFSIWAITDLTIGILKSELENIEGKSAGFIPSHFSFLGESEQLTNRCK